MLGGVRWNAVADSLEATGGATAGGEAVLDRAEYVAISRLLFKARCFKRKRQNSI